MFARSLSCTTDLPLRKNVLPPNFNSVDFWSNMSCIVLDFELADKNVVKELEVFLRAKFRVTLFVLQKSTNPQSKRFALQETYTEVCGTVKIRITMSFDTFYLEI